ncbi:MAG TPA: hypothetical protein PKG74_01260 [Candidatus Colwellbacteria bacterium]|nr:hypothetical protein [Candidatus Colwellbacteria bacterium]
MRRLISVSTGCFYKLGVSKEEIFGRLKALDIDGVEVLFNKPQDVFDFEISEDNSDFLRSLSFVTIHAPDNDLENPAAIEVLNRLDHIYRLIYAKNIVFHVRKDDDLSIFFNYGFKASMENDDWRKEKETNTVPSIERLLRIYPRLGFVLDVGHADSVDPADAEKYADRFKDRITEIHLSRVDKEKREHDFMNRHRESLNKKVFEATRVPIIIEGALQNENVSALQKEIELARKL